MKKVLYNISAALFAAAMIFTAASCSKQETPNLPEEPKAETITLSASMELPDSETKTSLDGLSVKWSDGDRISVFFGNNTTNNEFTLSSGDGETSGSFTGEASQASETLYAVYPYKSTMSISGNTVSLTLPAVQTYKAGGFADGMNPAVASTYDCGNLEFKNICGILKLDLKLPGSDDPTVALPLVEVKLPIQKIVIYSHTDKLSGEGTVRDVLVLFPEGDTAIQYFVKKLEMSPTASNTVTLDVGGATISNSSVKSFYIVLPPTTGKLYVTVFGGTSSTSTMTKSTVSTISRNKIRPMPTLDFVGVAGVSLSAQGTSNCYIVSEAGNYSFDATVMGNGAVGIISGGGFPTTDAHITPAPVSAQILWQDKRTSLQPPYTYPISDVSLTSGRVTFKASGVKGNAVIAVYDGPNGTGNILWSWHIWCTDTPAEQPYKNLAGKEFKLLDRNLGATAATPIVGPINTETLPTYGLIYQWGRKDPFPGSAGVASNTEKELNKSDGSTYTMSDEGYIVATDTDKGTIDNTIANPAIFYYGIEASSYDWHYASRNNYLWGNPRGYAADYTASKSIYDPCPPGYMVAPNDTWTRFTSTGKNSLQRNEFNLSGSFDNGWTFHTTEWQSGSSSWYPAAGNREYINGSLSDSGYGGYCWSSSPSSFGSYKAGYLMSSSLFVRPQDYDNRAYGLSVRCSLVGGK